MKLDILAIGVHPDDVELGCSGTLLKHIQLGYQVGIADLTSGQLGTRGTPELRLQEAEKARKILGVAVRENLGMQDGFFEIDQEHLLAVIRIIRKYKPTVVFANAPEDRHPDHGRAAKLVSRACFLSGLIKVETEMDGQPQAAHRPTQVLHYLQDHFHKPDLVVDITGQFSTKMEAILAFDSQFYKEGSTEPETPISGKSFS